MPFVHVELVEGRSTEVKKALAKEITESVMKHTGAPREAIYVIYNEMSKENFYPHGEPKNNKKLR
ncbi:2-hydroxymuconate tautomerase [Lactococcus garvieae]|uniref:4-oxalocrotonate tautomerase / Xylose transport system permease protein xylH n=1 Tax=Lactococcus garvieae DCC43 TaxID=1231377 RepID=K2PKG7_9LACT|nr:2-hydroxymuconate tautomerase [Lactococcus garvieae]EKF50694.1 4-oxalocrotonate tautomerase / Xylose transport system permease protein xylH [Lactococcus garvieae DCC43]